MEAALFSLTRQNIRIHCAGRTDAGVHAYGQRAHFDAPDRNLDWRKCLNAVLPVDIRVIAAQQVPDNFHARKDACAKTYFYQFWTEPAWTPPHLRNYVWACGPLNLDAINQLLPQFRGEHDFAVFQNAGTPVQTTTREILDICITEKEISTFLPNHAPLLRLTITGTGFLKQMVRNIAGLLAAVGRQKLQITNLDEIFSLGQRKQLQAPTAPAKGLFLAHVDYGEKIKLHPYLSQIAL